MIKTFFFIVAFAFGFAITTARTVKGQTLAQVLAQIETNCQGLVFISETDAEVHSFVAKRQVSVLTKQTFLQAQNLPPLSTVTQQTFDEFFTHILGNDTTGKWETFKFYLDEKLTSTTVFKVWTSNTSYDLYIVGLFPGTGVGNFYIVGAQSYGVAT